MRKGNLTKWLKQVDSLLQTTEEVSIRLTEIKELTEGKFLLNSGMVLLLKTLVNKITII